MRSFRAGGARVESGELRVEILTAAKPRIEFTMTLIFLSSLINHLGAAEVNNS